MRRRATHTEGLLLSCLLLGAGCGDGAATVVDAGAPSDGAAVADLARDDTPDAPPAVGRRLRLLTRAEYDNTVSDLLGVKSTFGGSFPAEVVVAGFDNNAQAGVVGDLLGDKLRSAAEALAEQVAGPKAAGFAALVDCGAAMDEGCARRFIERFGRRAFRRPLRSDEIEAYTREVFAPTAAELGFTGGVKWTLAALLQSPHFLYRTELGPETPPLAGPVRLTDHEIASELSYLLWASMPDEELLNAADAGQLHTAEQVAGQARRLFASPRSRASLDRFVTRWLKLDAVLWAPKDPVAYPDFTPAVRAALLDESRELFDRVMHKGQFPQMLATPYAYLTLDLARYYGLPLLPIEMYEGGIGKWNVSGIRHGGILLGAVTAAQGKADRSDPIHRGKLVREQLLCQSLPMAPAGLNLDLPPLPPGGSQRAQLAAHSSDARCIGCHEMLDPIGLSFERYDGVGRYHEKDEGGAPIDDSGEIRRSPRSDGTFHGVLELELKLAASRDVHDCFALQWFRYGFGMEESEATAAMVARAQAAFNAGSLALEPLLLALTQLPEFRYRAR